MKNMKFTMQFRGVGFSKKIADKNSQFDERPSQRITTEVSGPGKNQEYLILNQFELFIYLIITHIKQNLAILELLEFWLSVLLCFSKKTLRFQSSKLSFMYIIKLNFQFSKSFWLLKRRCFDSRCSFRIHKPD